MAVLLGSAVAGVVRSNVACGGRRQGPGCVVAERGETKGQGAAFIGVEVSRSSASGHRRKACAASLFGRYDGTEENVQLPARKLGCGTE